MIRRVEDAPQLVHPMGWISEGRADHYVRPVLEPQRQVDSPRALAFDRESQHESPAAEDIDDEESHQ